MRFDLTKPFYAIVFASALGASTLVSAQWDGSASQQLGMGHGFTALSQSTMRNAMQNDSEGADSTNYAGSGMTRDGRLAELRHEYADRVRRDGQASADAWAFEMGRRDADSIAKGVD